MVKEVGLGSDHGAGVTVSVEAVDVEVVSVLIRRSLLVRWRARFSAEAAGMVEVMVERNGKVLKESRRMEVAVIS